MTFIIRPSALEDAEERVEVMIKAYANHPIIPYFMSEVPHKDQLAFYTSLMSKGFGERERRDLEVVDTETGKIVAFAHWQYPRPNSPNPDEEGAPTPPVFPPGSNIPLLQAMFTTFGVLVDRHMDPEKMYFLNSLAVLPEYQRRGLGQMLMEPALADADRDSAQAFLAASPAGKGLYTKVGFRDLENKEFDFVELGALEKYIATAQIRDPRQI